MTKVVGPSGQGHVAPQPPTGSTGTDQGSGRAYNNGQARVDFTAPTNTGRLPVTSYTATSSPGGFTASGSASPLTITGLSSATSYTYTVTATNSVGTSSSSVASAPVTATTVPQAPTAVSAADVGTSRPYNNGAATVTVTAGATGGSTITSYGATSTPGSFTGSSATSSVSVTGLASATSYTFTSTTTNANGTSTASGSSGAITATTVPQAPTIGTVTVTNPTTVSIPFTTNASGGKTVTSYTVTSSPSISLGVSLASGSYTTSGVLTVTGTFASGQAYTFTLANANANGTSTSSAASNSVTPYSGNFNSIATVTAAGGETSLTLSSIPSTYTHLHIRCVMKISTTNVGDYGLYLRFNGDSGTNYVSHGLYGTNSTADVSSITPGGNYVSSAGSFSFAAGGLSSSTGTSNMYGCGLIDIHEYKSTTKLKTARYVGGSVTNFVSTAYGMAIHSGLWKSTAAITSITFLPVSGTSFVAGTTFALYGIN